MKGRVDVRGTQGLVRALQKVGANADEALRSALYIEAEQVMALSKQEAPVGVDGQLRASGYVDLPKKEGTRIHVTMGYNAQHALFVHEGTGPAVGKAPFFPPPSAFVQWVKKFLGASAKDAGTESDPGPTAWFVARAVGRRGLAPSKFLERPLKARLRGMAGRMAKRVRAGLKA